MSRKKKKTSDKIINFLEKNFIIFLTYAVLGWIYEFLWFFLVEHKIVNRGFLFGPYLPIYGFGALILYYLLWNFKQKKHKIGNVNINVFLIFIAIFFITTIVEYIGHYILDTYFGIVLWDYSKDALNINGRVCFAASRNFAIGGTCFLYFIQPIIEKVTSKYKNNNIYHITVLCLFIIVLFDFILKII